MTLPNETRRAAPFQHIGAAGEFAARIVGHAIRRRRIQARSPELCEPGGVSLNDPGHAGPATVVSPTLGGLVKVSDGGRQRRHELDIEGVERRQSIEQCLLREPVHLDEPVDGPAISPKRMRAVVLASDRDDSAIERWSCPPVEAKFRLAQEVAAPHVEKSR